MNKKLISISFIISVIIYATGCENENKNNGVFSGKMIAQSPCKSNKSTDVVRDTTDNLSCVDYKYESSTGKLALKHINAGFNCCPNRIYCDITLNGDTILINEHETDGPCDCDCLYDLDIEIAGMEAKSYQVKLIEPYAYNQEQLNFSIDLAVVDSGTVCALRNNYPWGIYGIQFD